MHWVNGQLATTISVSDRSFQYGDGCFTTLLSKNKNIQNWPLHIERMQACLDLLAIPSPDWSLVKTWLDKAALSDERAGLKLHISRGAGGRGYNPSGAIEPLVTINCFSYPKHYFDWQQNGVELGVCQRKLGIMPLLAGHKHNNRLEQVLIRAELEPSDFQDGVVMDINNRVIETTMANLFWIKQGVLYTPCLMSCGVAGVIRRKVIEEAHSRGMDLQIGDYTLEQLKSADEVFMTNSILGVAPVKKIEGSQFPIGANTRSIQEKLDS